VTRAAALASPWALLALVVLAFGVRYAAMERTFPVRPMGDEYYYLVVASNLVNGRGHVYGASSRALRPPAHPYLLSKVVETNRPLRWNEKTGAAVLDIDALRPVLLLQIALGTLLVLATALLGRTLFGPREGFLAGLLAALYPTFIAYSHYLFSETLFAALVTTGLVGVVYGAQRGGLALAAVTGLVFGAATLTREIALPVAGVCALWWVVVSRPGARRGAALRGAVLVVCAGLIVVPWTLRNVAVLGRVVPVSTVGWMATAEGNSLEDWQWLDTSSPGRREFRREYMAIDGEMARADFARQRTFERIRAEQPLWLAEKLVRNVPLLLSPDAFSFIKLRRGSYGEVSPWTRGWLRVATLGSYGVVFLAGVLGIATSPGGGRRTLALLVLAVAVSIHVFANATPRFRMPWMPILMVFASHAALRGRGGWRELGAAGRIATLAVAVVFAGVFVSYLLGAG
jgi:4-amino-4-deoxy-L-arabinose transferase-like glycosyltransferase